MPTRRPIAPVLLLSLLSCGDATDREAVPSPSPTSPPASDGAGSGPVDAVRPDLAAEALERGRIAAQAGDMEGAIAEYRTALAHDPGDAKIRLVLGRALIPLSQVPAFGSSARDQSILDEAIEQLQTARELRPQDAIYAYWLGRALDVAGRPEEALPHLERAVELDPADGYARKRLGMVLVTVGESERAKVVFRETLAVLPDDPGLRFQLGNLTLEDDPEEARALFAESVELRPNFVRGYHGLSQALMALGDVDGARAAQEAVERCRVYEERRDAAAQKANRAPTDFAAQVEAGEWHRFLGDTDMAVAYYLRALQLDPGSSEVHHACGLALADAGDLEAARMHFEEALFGAPGEVATKIELLRTCALQGDEARFAELASELDAELEGADVPTRSAYAEALLLGDRVEEARALLEVLAELAPEDEGVQILLERAGS